MISFTSAQLDAWLVALIFPLTRILALIATAPIIGNRQVPVRVKVGLAVILTIVIVPTLGELPQVSVGSAQGMLILVQQIIIGTAMGFTMRMIFTAVEMAGDLAGMQMGLGFASFFDPVNASFTPILAQWMGVVASLAFLAMNGHLFMFMGLAESFRTLPIGQMMPHSAYFDIALWGGNIFAYAVQISLTATRRFAHHQHRARHPHPCRAAAQSFRGRFSSHAVYGPRDTGADHALLRPHIGQDHPRCTRHDAKD